MQAFMWESVLKCKFSDYSGVVRPTDQETTAIEKSVSTHSPRVGGGRTTRGSTGRSGGGGAQSCGRMGAFIVASAGGRSRQGEQAEDWLV